MAVQPPANFISTRSYRVPTRTVPPRIGESERGPQARARHEIRCTLGNPDARAGGVVVTFVTAAPPPNFAPKWATPRVGWMRRGIGARRHLRTRPGWWWGLTLATSGELTSQVAGSPGVSGGGGVR